MVLTHCLILKDQRSLGGVTVFFLSKPLIWLGRGFTVGLPVRLTHPHVDSGGPQRPPEGESCAASCVSLMPAPVGTHGVIGITDVCVSSVVTFFHSHEGPQAGKMEGPPAGKQEASTGPHPSLETSLHPAQYVVSAASQSSQPCRSHPLSSPSNLY